MGLKHEFVAACLSALIRNLDKIELEIISRYAAFFIIIITLPLIQSSHPKHVDCHTFLVR